MRNFHQLLASFRPADAISNEALVIRDIIRSWGYESEIIAETKIVPPGSKVTVKGLDSIETMRSEDILLLHLSSGSKANHVFRDADCRKALLYHNITPPEYFHGIQEQVAIVMRKGREDLEKLADVGEIVMADSHYNARELEEAGYGNVEVMPLLLDFKKTGTKPDRKMIKRFDDGKLNLLFVGRCVPNKRIEDLVACHYYLRNYVNSDVRLIHAGSTVGMEQYHALLMTYVRDLGLPGVEFLGEVTQEELSACYSVADVFLSMSEHEGFCIPVLEAMAYDLPVVAYDAGAVGDTLGGAGVLCKEKRFDQIAEMIEALATRNDFRESIIASQRERLREYRQRDLASELKCHLGNFLEA